MGINEDLGTWADVADVYKFTNQTVGEGILVQAQDIIDLFSGTTFDSREHLGSRNLRHLNRAVAYQAGWMPHHPDIFTHLDLSQISQDGTSLTPAHDNASILAPFALRWLRRLTWIGRPAKVRRRLEWDDSNTNRDSAVADDNRIWTPMRSS